MSRRDIKAGGAFVELTLRNSKFVRGLRNSLRRMESFAKGIAVAGVAAGAAAAGGMALAIKAASDMQEVMSKFNVVFGSNANAVKAWGDDFAGTVGRSKKQIAEFLASNQDLFVPLGFEPGAAESMSKQITKLAVDLGSFNNKSDTDVMRDLQAALTGSGEVMKKYGVIVSEAAVKQELLNQGLDPKVATDQLKVQARLNIIMRGTTAAQGDAVRTSGSFANQMKALKAAVADVAVALGSVLLPIVTPVVTKFVDGIKFMGEVMATGNLGDAAELLFTGIRVKMLEGVAALSSAVGGELGDFLGSIGSKFYGGDFAGAWNDAVAGMAEGWANFSQFTVDSFAEASRGIISLMDTLSQRIAEFFTWLASKDSDFGKLARDIILPGTGGNFQERGEKIARRQRELGIGSGKNDAADIAFADVGRQFRVEPTTLRKVFDSIADPIQDMAAQSARDATRNRRNQTADGVDLASKALKQAQDELDALRSKLKAAQPIAAPGADGAQAGARAGGKGGGQFGIAALAGFGGIGQFGKQLDQMQNKVFVTFSAAAAEAKGRGGGPQQKQLQTLVEMRETLKGQYEEQKLLRRQLGRGGLIS